MTPVSSFLYRLPRFPIEFPFPVVFVLESRRVTGQCLNLSDTGLMAEFVVPVAKGMHGTLHMQPAGYVLEVPVSVAHSQGFRAGLLFAFANAEQQQMIEALVQAIAEHRIPDR